MLVALAVVVLLIGSLAAMFFTQQRRLMYFPSGDPPGSVAALVPGARDVRLRTSDGLDLDAWLLTPRGVDRRTAVLFCPGNGGNRAMRLALGRRLSARGFTVLLLDYRGYGGNPGAPSEEGLTRDGLAGVAFLRSAGFPAGRTIYLGESIGTGVTANLAREQPPAGIALRSPFPRFSDVVRASYPWLPIGSWMLRDRFETADSLAGSRVPVTVLAGEPDDIVPVGLSREVAGRVGRLHELVVLPDSDHNDPVWLGPVVVDAVARLADATVR